MTILFTFNASYLFVYYNNGVVVMEKCEILFHDSKKVWKHCLKHFNLINFRY